METKMGSNGGAEVLDLKRRADHSLLPSSARFRVVKARVQAPTTSSTGGQQMAAVPAAAGYWLLGTTSFARAMTAKRADVRLADSFRIFSRGAHAASHTQRRPGRGRLREGRLGGGCRTWLFLPSWITILHAA